MGKQKRGRHKFHTPAHTAAGTSKSKMGTGDSESMDVTVDKGDKASVKKARSVAASRATSNPFQGLKITTETLKQTLPELDSASVVTSRTFRGMNIKKKDKQRLRHDLFMEKIDAVQTARRERKARKKREQTAVVGDMWAMAEALPTLDLLMKESSATVLDREKKGQSSKAIASEKQRQNQMAQDRKVFLQVLDIPEYKADPAATMLEHLRNKLKQEEMDT